MGLVWTILLPLVQVNFGGLWFEVPSTDNQAELIDEGMATPDELTTYVWAAQTGKYVSIEIGPIPLVNGITEDLEIENIKFAIRGYHIAKVATPTVGITVYLSAQPIITEFMLSFEDWVEFESRQVVFPKAEFLAPWEGLTVGTWNSEEELGSGGAFRIYTYWGAPGDPGDEEYEIELPPM